MHLYDLDESEPLEQLPDGLDDTDDDEDANLRVGGPSNGGGLNFTGSRLATAEDGNVVAARSGREQSPSNVLHIWDLVDGGRSTVRFPGGLDYGEHFALSPDGRTVFASAATDSEDEVLVVAIDVQRGEELFRTALPLPASSTTTPVVGASAGGDLLVAVMPDRLVVLDAATGEPYPAGAEPREAGIGLDEPSAFGADITVTGGYDTPLLWNLHTAEDPLELTNADADMSMSNLSLSADGERIIGTGHSGGVPGVVAVWNRSGELVEEELSSSIEYSASAAAPSGDGVLVSDRPHQTIDSSDDEPVPDRLRLLDENLETEREYELPAPGQNQSD